jgi:hypothetical protein
LDFFDKARGYVEIRRDRAAPERGSRAWTSLWTGKKTPAYRLAHPPPLFHIPTGPIVVFKENGGRARATARAYTIRQGKKR